MMTTILTMTALKLLITNTNDEDNTYHEGIEITNRQY